MNSSKFTHVHVYIIGGVLMLLLGVGLWFALIKPVNEENVALAGQVSTAETTTVSVDSKSLTIMPTWETQKTLAEEALEGAKQRQAGKVAELASLENKKQIRGPRQIDLGDGTQAHLLRVTMPRWLTLPQYVVGMMNTYARRRAFDRRVTVTTNFKAPAPSTDPNQIPRRIIAWNLGPITATGEFNRVMQWAEDWNQAPLLVAVDGLRLSLAGRNGWVTATGNLTVYVFPTGEAVTNAPAAPGAGGAPGAGSDPALAGAAGGYPGTGGPAPGGGSPGASGTMDVLPAPGR